MTSGLKILEEHAQKDLLRFVTAGSVDDGKSTLIGRLLYESKNIYEDQLQAVERASARHGGSGDGLNIALLTDGLKAEREQGITIDVAYRYFSTPKRKFIIADTPGHEQYTRNTATGASTANLMIILIDAQKGVKTQSKRHAFIASLLGIKHLVVAVNKMDLVGYSKQVFDDTCSRFADFCIKLEISDFCYIPVCALKGDNVVALSDKMPWYNGSPLLNHLETVQVASDRNLIDLRFPVQLALRPDSNFRGYLGTLASGTLKAGAEVMVLPGGNTTRVDSIFTADGSLDEAFAPQAVGVCLCDDIDVSRGDMLVHPHNVPHIGNSFEAMVVWMSQTPMEPDQIYIFKHTTRTVTGVVSSVRYGIDVDTLHRQQAHSLGLNEIGRCSITLNRPIAYDPYANNRATGAFIIIDRVTNNTVGAGMILAREANQLQVSPEKRVTKPKSRYIKPRHSRVTMQQRTAQLGQQPVTVWLTGLPGAGKTTIGYALEQRLFSLGYKTYVLDGENIRLGLNKDLNFIGDDRSENVRRTAEVAKMLNEAGLIAVCSLISPYAQDRQNARQIVGQAKFVEVYLSAPADVRKKRVEKVVYDLAQSGDIKNFSGITAPYEVSKSADLVLPTDRLSVMECVDKIVSLLKEKHLRSDFEKNNNAR